MSKENSTTADNREHTENVLKELRERGLELELQAYLQFQKRGWFSSIHGTYWDLQIPKEESSWVEEIRKEWEGQKEPVYRTIDLLASKSEKLGLEKHPQIQIRAVIECKWRKKENWVFYHETIENETPIEANWIHSIPHSWQVAFLQGVCDGDGHASFKSQKVGITSKVNTNFLESLLRCMGIEPVNSKIRVEVLKKDSIKKMHEFPMFRYATGRQHQLSQIVAMLSLTGHNKKRPDGTRKLVHELSSCGFSSGEISEKLWLEHSIALRSGSIRTMLREAKMK